MAIEIEALQSARDRAEQETQEAEITAKARAVEVVLPQYREKIYAVQLAFERAIAVNEELEGFETYIARQGLGQEHRAFRQPHHIVGISFPFGLKDWVISTQIVMKQG